MTNTRTVRPVVFLLILITFNRFILLRLRFTPLSTEASSFSAMERKTFNCVVRGKKMDIEKIDSIGQTEKLTKKR